MFASAVLRKILRNLRAIPGHRPIRLLKGAILNNDLQIVLNVTLQ